MRVIRAVEVDGVRLLDNGNGAVEGEDHEEIGGNEQEPCYDAEADENRDADGAGMPESAVENKTNAKPSSAEDEQHDKDDHHADPADAELKGEADKHVEGDVPKARAQELEEAREGGFEGCVFKGHGRENEVACDRAEDASRDDQEEEDAIHREDMGKDQGGVGIDLLLGEVTDGGAEVQDQRSGGHGEQQQEGKADEKSEAEEAPGLGTVGCPGLADLAAAVENQIEEGEAKGHQSQMKKTTKASATKPATARTTTIADASPAAKGWCVSPTPTPLAPAATATKTNMTSVPKPRIMP